MDVGSVIEWLSAYGILALFVLVLLEYMNMPGFPAGVIMPISGMLASNGKVSLLVTYLVALAAGLIGSWILYFLGYFGGDLLLNKCLKKSPGKQEKVQKLLDWVSKKGYLGLFVAKLIPMIRTLIAIPAGAAKMNFYKYTIYSALGIFIWNFFFIGIGYWLGDAILPYIS